MCVNSFEYALESRNIFNITPLLYTTHSTHSYTIKNMLKDFFPAKEYVAAVVDVVVEVRMWIQQYTVSASNWKSIRPKMTFSCVNFFNSLKQYDSVVFGLLVVVIYTKISHLNSFNFSYRIFFSSFYSTHLKSWQYHKKVYRMSQEIAFYS